MGKMKIKTALYIMLLFPFQSCLNTVPKVVDDAFIEKFFDAKDVVWVNGPNNDWIVTFYIKKFHYIKAYYTPIGTCKAFEIEVHDADIPKEFVNIIFSKFPGATLYNVFEKKSEKTTAYIFELEDNGQLFGIYFMKDGTYHIIPPDDFRFTSRIHIEND